MTSVLEGKVLGKPVDEEDAKTMLASLSDRTHQVYTGVALFYVKKGTVEKRETFPSSTTMVSAPITRQLSSALL